MWIAVGAVNPECRRVVDALFLHPLCQVAVEIDPVLDGIDSETHDILGISVRHRQPGPLLREAERRRDLMTQEALKNPEGELVDYEVKVEISLELLDRRGKATISMERLANLDEASQVARFLIGDWARFVRLTSGDDAFINL